MTWSQRDQEEADRTVSPPRSAFADVQRLSRCPICGAIRQPAPGSLIFFETTCSNCGTPYHMEIPDTEPKPQEQVAEKSVFDSKTGEWT